MIGPPIYCTSGSKLDLIAVIRPGSDPHTELGLINPSLDPLVQYINACWTVALLNHYQGQSGSEVTACFPRLLLSTEGRSIIR